MKTKICIKMSHSKPKTRVVNMQKTSLHLVLHVTHLSQTFTGEFSFKNPKSNLLNMQRMDAHLVLPHATHPLLVLIALTNTTKAEDAFFPKYLNSGDPSQSITFSSCDDNFVILQEERSIGTRTTLTLFCL